MSTRSIVAIPEGDGWKGRYVHFDGIPLGVGKSIWKIVVRDGIDAAIDTLVHKHYGWSAIDHDDRSWFDNESGHVHGYGLAYEPEDQGDWWIHAQDTDKSWCEWFYVITQTGLAVGWLSGPDYVPMYAGFVRWDDPNPDFRAIQDMAYERAGVQQ